MTMMNGDTGSVTTPTKRVDSNPGQTSKGRIRRERKAETSVTQTTSTNKGSIVWTILLAGLVFSLVDIFYIANYLERTSTTTHIIANVPIIAPLKNPSEFLIEQGTTDKDPESSPEHPAVTVLSVETPKENNDDNDKGPILKLLQEAGINLDDLDPTVMDSLPTWATVVKLYGDKPRIIGLDTCETYRLHTTDPAEHYLGVAGTFNTGTNLMAELLLANCHMPARMAKYGKVNRGIRWQVPWGKHTPVSDEQYRLTHKTELEHKIDAHNSFPAVTVRDPAAWMQSMCRHEYAMMWPHNMTGHCPNLVPSVASDYDHASSSTESVPVTIQYADFVKAHDSLLHHWNEYYTAYTQTTTFPRVIVRFEDLIFHPVAVTTAVCECAGGALERDKQGRLMFEYVTGSAKKGASHGKEKTGYLDSIIKYGNDRGDRWKGMTAADLEYVKEHLDPTLMALFDYHYPPATITS